MWKRTCQHSQESSPQRIQRHPASWPSEFELSDGQKDSLIHQQAAEIARLRARWHSVCGALERIKDLRSEDTTLVEFCQAVLSGKVKFSITGRAL